MKTKHNSKEVRLFMFYYEIVGGHIYYTNKMST